jgi:hypothetical protein
MGNHPGRQRQALRPCPTGHERARQERSCGIPPYSEEPHWSRTLVPPILHEQAVYQAALALLHLTSVPGPLKGAANLDDLDEWRGALRPSKTQASWPRTLRCRHQGQSHPAASQPPQPLAFPAFLLQALEIAALMTASPSRAMAAQRYDHGMAYASQLPTERQRLARRPEWLLSKWQTKPKWLEWWIIPRASRSGTLTEAVP